MKLKQIILVSGIVITLTCGLLPLFDSCRMDADDFFAVSYFGLESFPYYVSLFFLGAIIMFGYAGEGLPGKIVTIVCTLLGGAIFFFLVQLGKAGWGKPCGKSPTIYFNLLIAGQLLIVAAAFISLYNREKSSGESDLLDD